MGASGWMLPFLWLWNRKINELIYIVLIIERKNILKKSAKKFA